MKLFNIHIEKFDTTYAPPKRVGIIREYVYAAFYRKNILIGFHKQLHFLHKQIDEFIQNSKRKVDDYIKNCFEKVLQIDKNAKMSDQYIKTGRDNSSHDSRLRFEHRFQRIHTIEVELTIIQFRYENYSCTLTLKAKRNFQEFYHSFKAYNTTNWTEVTPMEVDINDLKSSMKMLRMHSIGIFDDD
jgi:hypothetical protein